MHAHAQAQSNTHTHARARAHSHTHTHTHTHTTHTHTHTHTQTHSRITLSFNEHAPFSLIIMYNPSFSDKSTTKKNISVGRCWTSRCSRCHGVRRSVKQSRRQENGRGAGRSEAPGLHPTMREGAGCGSFGTPCTPPLAPLQLSRQANDVLSSAQPAQGLGTCRRRRRRLTAGFNIV